MAFYRDEDQAAADGIRIEHQPEHQRYAVLREAEGAEPAVVGEAHYRLLGDDVIDFDHTLVVPPLRGTGLSELLARRAVTGDAAAGRRVMASCWFIRRYLAAHPEVLDAEGRQAG